MKTLNEQIADVIRERAGRPLHEGHAARWSCAATRYRALNALHAAGAPVTTVDILPDPRIRQELSALSGWPTIPQVFVKGELIGGADITEELLESGELDAEARRRAGLRPLAGREDRRARARSRLRL